MNILENESAFRFHKIVIQDLLNYVVEKNKSVLTPTIYED